MLPPREAAWGPEIDECERDFRTAALAILRTKKRSLQAGISQRNLSLESQMRSLLKALKEGYKVTELVLGRTSGEAAWGGITAQTYKFHDFKLDEL